MWRPIELHAQSSGAGLPLPAVGEQAAAPLGHATLPISTARENTSQAASPPPAAVSGRTQQTDRGTIGVNGMFQATSNGFTADTALTQYVESGKLTATYDSGRPPGLDVSGAVYVWRRLSVGAAVTWLTQDNGGSLTAQVPHPFLFGMPRTVSGVVASAPRTELAIHPDVSWTIPAGRRAQVTLFGGPSFFHVDQTLVAGVVVTEAYPYDTAAFKQAVTVGGSESQLGFNVGFDVSTSLSERFGIGLLTRYSRSSLDFPVAEGQEVTVHAGGLQVGGGLRVRF
jgi:hypothetical protein